MSVEYYYWSEDAYDWKLVTGSDYDSNPITSKDATGNMVIATLDDTAISGGLRPYHKVKIRVAYTADYAKTWFSERTVYDEFDIIFKEDCSDNVITLNSHI